MLEEKLYQSGDIKLNYVEGPDNGPAFLLLPAYDDRWQSYSSIIPQLAVNTHLYALDTRGRGKSGRAKTMSWSTASGTPSGLFKTLSAVHATYSATATADG